jgi:hypothetical protein
VFKKRGPTGATNPTLEVDTEFMMGRWEQLATEAARWVVVGIIFKWEF